MSNPPPLETFRHGRISVAVWSRRSKSGERFLAVSSPSRPYKVGDTWKRSYDLSSDEIRIAIELLRQAEHFMKQEERAMMSVQS